MSEKEVTPDHPEAYNRELKVVMRAAEAVGRYREASGPLDWESSEWWEELLKDKSAPTYLHFAFVVVWTRAKSAPQGEDWLTYPGEWEVQAFAREEALSLLWTPNPDMDISAALEVSQNPYTTPEVSKWTGEKPYPFVVNLDYFGAYFIPLIIFEVNAGSAFYCHSSIPVDEKGIPDPRIFDLPPHRWSEIPDTRGKRITVGDTAQSAPVRRGRPRKPEAVQGVLLTELGNEIPLVTSPEVSLWTECIANGRSPLWTKTLGGRGRVYRNPSKHRGLEARTMLTTPAHYSVEEVDAALTERLERWDLDEAILGLLVMGALAATSRANSTEIIKGTVAPVADISTDDLLRIVRHNLKSNEKPEGRRWVRRSLIETSEIGIYGKRVGRYIDPDTKEAYDQFKGEFFFLVDDRETTWAGDQIPVSAEMGNPLRLRVVGGSLCQTIAKYPKFLNYLGNVRYLVENTPGGQTAGQWAQAMGITFARFVREESHKAKPVTKITHRTLLCTFLPESVIENVFKQRFDRGVSYYLAAKKLLVELGWWEDFAEPPLPNVERGKLNAWLAQTVEPPVGDRLHEPVRCMTDKEDPLEQLKLAGETERNKRRRGRPRKKPELSS